MARSVTFSDDAFRILREEKRPGESDSDVLLRLAREARERRKDPRIWFERDPGELEWTLESLLAHKEAERKRDLERLRALRETDPE